MPKREIYILIAGIFIELVFVGVGLVVGASWGYVLIGIGGVGACFSIWRALRIKDTSESKLNYASKIIVDSKAKDLLAIPDALRALGELDVELSNRLSLNQLSMSQLEDIQTRLRKDWQMKGADANDAITEQIIRDAVDKVASDHNLIYTSLDENTMHFMMHVAGVLDDTKVGITNLRERYHQKVWK